MSIFDNVFSEYKGNNVGDPITQDMIAQAEKTLGYILPSSYVSILRVQNGGCLTRVYFPIDAQYNHPDQYAIVSEIMGVGGITGIDGSLGSDYLINEWGYPPIGIVIASEGHTAVMLDYTHTQSAQEPAVVYIDVEVSGEPTIVPLADTFADFIKGLKESAK